MPIKKLFSRFFSSILEFAHAAINDVRELKLDSKDWHVVSFSVLQVRCQFSMHTTHVLPYSTILGTPCSRDVWITLQGRTLS